MFQSRIVVALSVVITRTKKHRRCKRVTVKTPSRVHLIDGTKLSKIVHEMINVRECLDTYLQDNKSSTAERIDEIERLVLENVTENEAVETTDMKR